MANKSVRLLSLVLSVLMLATMIPVVANADYDYTTVEAPADYEIIDYNTLVGESNQKFATDVYVVDADWEFEKGKEPKKVTFNFRNKEVTENYDATRHFANANSALAQAKTDGVAMPKVILTAGNYSEQIALTGSAYLLGARAGLNPNVPSNDPSKKWEVSSDRSLAEYASADSKGETRFWIEGAVDVNAGYGGGGDSYTDFLIQNNASGDVKYVFDGLYLQGYGAVVRDTTGGSGNRVYIAQNCIFENGYSYDVSTFRLWNRGVNSKRELYVSNSYATGYKQLGFYSGQAAVVEFNGLCWQDNYAGLCYDVEHINMLGLKFSLKNSHFWNSEAVATSATLGGMFHYDRIFYSDFNQGVNNASYLGTNTEAYRYTISNNTFWNMERVSAGSFSTSYNLFEIPMGGENEQVVFSDNIIGNTLATAKRHPLQIRYLTVNGVPSHTHEKPPVSDASALYALTNERLQVNGNTFIGKAYTNVMPDIGNNTCPDTLVEMSGNFYTNELGGTIGTYVEGKFGDKIYDKWVWTDKSEEGMQDPKNRTDYINEEAFSLGGLTAPTVDPEDPYHYIFNVGTKASVMVWGNADNSADVNNIVKFYTADENYNKIAELTSSSLTAPKRENYYVASLLSKDRRTSVDYKITVVRDVYAGAEFAGIKEEAYPEIKFISSDEAGPDLYSYVVSYDNNIFDFALDVADDATTEVYAYNARGVRYLMENNGTANHYTYDLKETEKIYSFEIFVTSAAGKVEEYAMEVSRGLNNEAELLDVISNGNTVERDEANKTYTITTPIGAKNAEFSIEISKNASATVYDDLRDIVVTPVNGVYSTRVVLGTQTFTVEIVSQDQNNTEFWTIEIVRPASTAKDVLNVENATKNGSDWEANVEKEVFIVSATVSELASYALYADASCTDRIGNSAITLLNTTTKVYLLVTAEDGSTATVTLTIKTTKVATQQVPGEPGMMGNGVIAVSGATAFNNDTIYVDLGPNAKSYNFRVLGLNGYTVKVWGDANHTLWAPMEMKIVPDTAITLLYVTATNGSDTKEYVVEIDTTVPVNFSDKIVPWAEKYVKALTESQCGIIKGDEHQALNGQKNLTRYEMAVMMVRMLGVNKDLYSGVKLPFRDTIQPWAENYVKAAYRAELVGGNPITDADGAVVGYEYKGEDIATRSQFFKVFVNAVHGKDITEYYNKNKKAIDKFVTDKKFADVDKVAEWAKPYVYTTIYMGIVKGSGNTINPEGNITRYEAITMLCRQFFDMA